MITNKIEAIRKQFESNDDKKGLEKITFLKNEYSEVTEEIQQINNSVIEYEKTISPLVSGTEIKNHQIAQLQQFNPAVRTNSLNKYYDRFVEIVKNDYYNFQTAYFEQIGGQPIEPDTSRLKQLEVKQALIGSLTSFEQRNGYISTELSNQPLEFIKEYINKDSI